MKKKMMEKTPLRVLYLEDSPHDIEIIGELLTESGYDLSMDCTEKKKEFASFLSSHTYDVILSDFKLPGFDAFGALGLSKERCPDVPFICVSGSIGEETAIELIKQGAVDYILKDRLVRLPLAIKRALEEAAEKEALRRTEKALRESELKFRTVADYTYDWEYWENENHDIVYMSPSCERITGYSPQKFTEDPSLLKKIVHPEDIDFVIRHHERVFSLEHKHDVDEIEYRVIHKDGSIVHINHVCKPIFDVSDQYHGRRVSNRDITERKRAEAALTASEIKYRSFFENSMDAILLTIPDGRIISANPAACKMFGYSEDEMIHAGRYGVVDTTDSNLSMLLSERELDGRVQGELTFIRKDRTRFPAEISSAVFKNPEGQAYTSMIIRDITGRKQAEEELKKSEKKLREAQEMAHLGFWNWNVKTDEVEWSEEVFKIFYLDPKKFTPHLDSILALSPWPEDHHRGEELIKKAIETRSPGHYEQKFLRPDQSIGHYYSTFQGTYDKQGKLISIIGTILDITERKQAEELLRKSEEKYRSIFANIQDVYYEALMDGTLLEVSPSIEIFSKGQYHRNELIGKSMFDFYPNKIEREALLSALMEQGSVTDFEITLKNRDGSQITSSITSKVQCNAQGRPEKIMGTMRDISERKRIEEKNEEQARLLDIALDPIVVRDMDDKLQFWNQAAEHLYGWTFEEACSLDVHRLVNNDDQTTYEKNKEEFLQKGFWEGDLQQKTKDGRFITTHSRWTLVRDQQGKPASRLIVTRDVTENKKAEESLRNSNTFNELLLETIPFGMDIVDERGTILFLNDNMRKLLGSNAVGQTCWSAYKDDKMQCVDCPLRKGIEIGRFEILESANVLGGRIFQINHIGIMYQGKNAMLEVFVDITEQRKLQNQFLQSQKIQSIGTLAGGIAHDFNNILGIILMYASILEHGVTDKEKIVESSGAISKAVERGAALVRQILTFARQADVTFQPLRVPDLIHEITSMLKETFPKVIEIHAKYEKDMPFINADHSQMHQALLNLCVNARDAMPKGGTLSINVETVEQKTVSERFPEASSERFVCIAVSDTGTGIDAKIKNLIFDPFFTTKEKGKGTGLGLSVVYGVMQTHHGFVAMESEVGKGATFLLYLPIPHDPYTKLKTSETENLEPAGGTEGILIVEDEDILRKILKDLLESKGYHIYTATDGLEAVGKYQEHKDEINLVLTDMGLPRMSGTEVFKKMCEINARVKVLLASGFLEPDIKAELFKAGAKGFIQKPYNPYEVLKEIRKILDEPKQ